MRLRNLIVILLLDVILVNVKSARILAIYPMPSLSHQMVFRKLTLELIKHHEVTVITPNPAFKKTEAPNNLTEIDVQDYSYKALREFSSKWRKSEIKDKLSDRAVFKTFFTKICDSQLQDPQVRNVIFENTTNFDLILIEDLAQPFLGVSHISKAPVVLFSSYGGSYDTLDAFGLQTHPILYPSPMSRPFYDITLWDRVKKIFVYLKDVYYKHSREKEEHELMKKYFGDEVPPIQKLYENIDMLFVNINSLWVDNLPVSPNVVFLGGFHQTEKKELPTDLKNYLDSSKNGVIYVSFGTNALSALLSRDKVEIIAKVLGKMPYDVLWKWDADDLPGRRDNIRLSKWLPQADLLRHPKVKLFITQAGLQSTDEAITAGVPLLALPVLGDQWYNAEKYVRHGIGKQISFEDVTEEDLRSAVKTVIEDESYRKNINNLRELLLDQPMKPLDRAVFWVEHLIRHQEGKHLRAAGANLTWAEYYEIDLVLATVAVLLVSLYALGYLVYKANIKNVKHKTKQS